MADFIAQGEGNCVGHAVGRPEHLWFHYWPQVFVPCSGEEADLVLFFNERGGMTHVAPVIQKEGENIEEWITESKLNIDAGIYRCTVGEFLSGVSLHVSDRARSLYAHLGHPTTLCYRDPLPARLATPLPRIVHRQPPFVPGTLRRYREVALVAG